MKELRLSAVALVLHLALLFNIERLDYGGASVVDIPSFTYVLALAAIISVLTIPRLWRAPLYVPVALWLGIFLLSRGTLLDRYPLLGDVATFITFTEITLLTIGLWLAHRLAQHLHDFEQAVENITFEDVGRRVRTLEDATEDIQTEFTRSRRYGAPLSVVVVEPDSASVEVALHRTVQEVQRAMMSRYVLKGLVRVISNELRRTDFVFEQRRNGRFVILCPETTAEESAVVAERIGQAAMEQLGLRIGCGVAAFPEEALTFEQLVSQAGSSMKSGDAREGIPRRTVIEAAPEPGEAA
jgi:GGDEF domain-containing protein